MRCKLDFCIKKNNLILLVLGIAFICLLFFFMFAEFDQAERVILPILFSLIIASYLVAVLNIFNSDKFVPKIYLISVLVHFCFILFWQILKYYILGLPMPTDTNFTPFISDADGVMYHQISSFLADNYNLAFLSDKYYGGFFPKLIATLYHIFGKNPFIATCMNSVVASFVSVLVFLISKKVLKDRNLCKIYALLCVFCTSFIVNTSVLMRDGYITLFMYLSIYLSYKVHKTGNIIYIIFLLLSIYSLYLFRPYAAIMVILGIVFGSIFKHIRIKKVKRGIRANKTGIIFLAFLPFIILGLVFGLGWFISNQTLLHNELSVESLINLRETAYAVSNSTYSWDFNKLYHIFPLLPFLIGYLCLFFAPFPTEWIYVKRLHFVPDMLVLYCLLPSFIKNLKLIFKDKNYYLLVCFFTMICMFSIYCITVGNSGTIHRLRGPYIPMIYLIAMYRPDKFLSRILNKIQKWRLV